jgi:hypothetical protein
VAASTPRAVDRDRLLLAEDSSRSLRTQQNRSLALTADTRLLAFAALLATLVARALAPALPGSNAGSGRLISGVDQAAAFLSQFVLIVGAATAVRLLMRSMVDRRLGYVHRLVSVVGSAAAIPIVLSAANRQIEAPWLIALVLLSSAVALASLFPAMQRPPGRAAALTLGVATLASLVWAGSRVLALEASDHAYASLFEVAQGGATAGLLLDIASTLVAAVWLARQSRQNVWWLAAAVVAALALAWAGFGGAEAAPWRVVVNRSLAALAAHPDPFVSAALRYFVEAWAVLLASVALWSQRHNALGPAIVFALLARASGDVPICAMLLLLAALSMALATVTPSSGTADSLRAAGDLA